MSLKTRLLAGAGSLALAGSLMAVAAPAANAAPTVIGACGGQVGLATFFNSAGSQVTLTDNTQIGLVVKTKLLKDQTTKTLVNGGGDCSGVVRPGDPIHPAGGLVSPLTPKAEAAKLVGNISCAPAGTEPSDLLAAAAWPASGKISFTMTQLNDLAKPYQIQAYVSLLGINGLGYGPDTVDLGGLVSKGVDYGATVSGTIWQDPVLFTGGATGYNTGWELDLLSAVGCGDGSAVSNASIAQTMFGGGTGSSTSLIGSPGVPGVGFSLGE